MFLLLLSIQSCKKDIEKKEAYKKGNLTIVADPSYENLGSAFADVYQAQYPEAKINFQFEPEDLAIVDFLNGKYTFAMVSRDLTAKERKLVFDNSKINIVTSQIACDATILITSVKNPISAISLSDIKNNAFTDQGNYVFDGGNSSNLNTLTRTVKYKIPKNQKIRALKDAYQVIENIKSNSQLIGVIGFDILSDQGDPKVQEILKQVKILAVEVNNKNIYPTVPNLRENKYPFTKRLYMHNREAGFFLGSGFLRFCGSQQGQLIVSRLGLQPYNIYPRKVEIIDN